MPCASANIKGALVGVEAVTPEGLKDVYKGFNEVGEALVQRLRKFREHGVYVLGSFIFGLAERSARDVRRDSRCGRARGLAFAQFVMLTPYPGTIDFEAWEKKVGDDAPDGRRHSDHAPLADPAGSTGPRSTRPTR